MTTFQTSHLNFTQWLSDFLKEHNSESKEIKQINIEFVAIFMFWGFFFVFMSMLGIIMTIEWHLVDMMLYTNISKAKTFWNVSVVVLVKWPRN